MGKLETDRVIKRAFEKWAEVTPLSFAQITDGKVKFFKFCFKRDAQSMQSVSHQYVVCEELIGRDFHKLDTHENFVWTIAPLLHLI